MSVHLILVQAIGFFGTILFFLSYQFFLLRQILQQQSADIHTARERFALSVCASILRYGLYMISLSVLGREYWMKLSAKHPCCCPLFAMDGKI